MAGRACRDCHALISSFIDGEASREENARVRQHLANCADCRTTLDAYRDIGGSIRSLPAVHAPGQLTDAIFAQTVDAEPRRLFLITSRLGYSLAAVASVLLIFVVAAYLIIGGYERGLDPTVAASAPEVTDVQDEPLIWPLQKPVEIQFNKDMNRESVIAALGMVPPGEKERLSMSWEGNTLVIGATTPFKPETDYEIKISTDATDKWGNHLKTPFQLAFTTSSSQTMVQTPTPEPTPEIKPTDTAEPSKPTESPSATEPMAVVSQTPEDDDPVAPTETADNDPAPGSGNGTQIVPVTPVVPTDSDDEPADPTATPTSHRPTATATPTEPADEPEPTLTATLSPTATSTALPPTPTPTATATATATTPAPASPTVAATETADSIPAVTGAIGDIYWRDQTVQERLGKPTFEATSFVTDQLDFQSGVMLLDESHQNIYVLKFGSGWEWYGVPSGDTPQAQEVEPGIYVPGGVFGALWNSNSSVSDFVGYALTPVPATLSATVQEFQNGRILATSSTVYVLYDDLTWDWFNHNSGS